MSKICRLIVGMVVMLLACLQAKADSIPYIYRNISIADGLSDLVVNTIYKDSLGYVWIGTNTSLERFDGIRLKHYLTKGASAAQKRVYAVAEGAGGELWIGTGVGLWRLNKQQEVLERIAPDEIDTPVNALLYDGRGTLYIGTDRGLFYYREGKIRHFLVEKNVLSLSNRVKQMSFGRDRTLWMATGKGLARMELEVGKMLFYPYAAGFSTVTTIGDDVYLGTMTQGLLAFDRRTGTFRPYLNVGCPVISTLSSDGKDLLYVGTDGNGAHFISVSRAGIVRSFVHRAGGSESIHSNSVYSLLVDRDGLIWFGFYQLGFDYTLHQNRLFDVYRYCNLFDSKEVSVRTFSFHDDEKLIGTREGLFFIDERNQRFRSYGVPQLRAKLILSSCYWNGAYYIGTYGGGMYVLYPKDMQLNDFYPDLPNPFLHGHIFCIRPDGKGNLWIGTSDGVFCYNGKEMKMHYTSAQSKLPEGNVYEIFFDSSGKGWICTEEGMCIWEPSSRSLKTDVFPSGFIHKEKVRMIYEDASHHLYFLPEKGNLFVSDLSMETYQRVSERLLSDKTLMSVIEDRKGWLWITTNYGMYRYDKKNLVIPYGISDGIPSQIFINCQSVKDEEGGLWFGNSKGLLSLQPESARVPSPNYKLAISDVKVNGALLTGRTDRNGVWRELVLDGAQKNNIVFQISPLNYMIPTDVSYEYMLEGESEHWIQVQEVSEVSFYNLRSGIYRFRVRAIGYPESEVSVRIQIASAFDWKIWSGLILLLGCLGGIGMIILSRRKKNGQPEEAGIQAELPVAVPLVELPGKEVVSQEVQEPVEYGEVVPELHTEKYKTNKVSEVECKRLFKKLEYEMKYHKPYKNPELKIADLAQSIHSTPHVLSYIFNQYLKKNYYDYINDYRVEEFKELVVREEYSKYTLNALAEACGFSSRASFFRYFKKSTGITPNEYIRTLQK